ncbi:MAG: GNAT family N-acetyltransferase [Armatimonadetes bacterium]|nr:GNAT family N-acetyltransferase [Armatimonadota bacterium]
MSNGPSDVTIEFASASFEDADELVAIRIAAMRESLERVGRFSPDRARERFLSSFDPSVTKFILVDGVRAGFFVVKPETDGLLLDHLYVLPEFQRRGIGRHVLKAVFRDADERGLTMTVGALKESDSNRFYVANGFEPVGEGEWDNYYRRLPNE